MLPRLQKSLQHVDAALPRPHLLKIAGYFWLWVMLGGACCALDISPSTRQPDPGTISLLERLAAYARLKREGWGRRRLSFSRSSTFIRAEVRPDIAMRFCGVWLCAMGRFPLSLGTTPTEVLDGMSYDDKMGCPSKTT